MRLGDNVRASFSSVLAAMDALPKDLGAGVLAVRPGYRYGQDGDKVTAKPAIVLAVTPNTLGDAKTRATALEQSLKVPVEAQVASVEEQLAVYDNTNKSFTVPNVPKRSAFELALRNKALPDAFAVRKSQYEPPKTLTLPRTKDRMKVRLSVSPEHGWSTLSAFLDTATSSLTIGMYEFTAPQIADKVTEVAKRISGDTLLTLHPVPEKPGQGVKADDRPEAEVLGAIKTAAKGRFGFQWAPVFGDGARFASAYHIKVAVADSARFWLSSGNWQSSNQPNDDVTAKVTSTVQRKYNREYHAVIEHEGLANVFEGYLKFDFETAKQVEHPDPKDWEGPAVLVPKDFQDADFAPHDVVTFDPFEADREFDIQPLLTPDNFAPAVLDVIKSAKRRIWFQNQYINLSPSENGDIFEQLVETLIEKQQSIGDVRVICRDMMTTDKVDLLVAKGFDPSGIRFQASCHNKCILVDSQVAIFGSHNWSNDGVLYNRDASLIFYDAEVCKYFEPVYDYDWKNLATAKASKPRAPRVGSGTSDDSFAELGDLT
jgi:PLD-like domain